jgi:hypothetical protein
VSTLDWMLEDNSDHFQEHMATQAEADDEEARNVGMDNPDREWICTDRDVWHKNPFYTGKPSGYDPRDEHFIDAEMLTSGPTDEMLQNWQEENDYTHEGEGEDDIPF